MDYSERETDAGWFLKSEYKRETWGKMPSFIYSLWVAFGNSRLLHNYLIGMSEIICYPYVHVGIMSALCFISLLRKVLCIGKLSEHSDLGLYCSTLD
jgi:hypothetical protein